MAVVLQIEDLVDLSVWDHVLRFAPGSVRNGLDVLLRDALQAVCEDRHFAAEKSFSEILALIESQEGTLIANKVELRALACASSSPAAAAGVAGKREPLATVMGLRMLADFIRSCRGYEIAVRKSAEGREIIAECDPGNQSWKPVSVDQSTGYGTYYRGEPGSSIHSFKVVGMVKAEVISLAAVLLELDLYKEWFPFCFFSEVVKEHARFHKSSRFGVRLPWPISNREVAITGFGIDDLDNNRVVVKASTDPSLGETPAKSGNQMAILSLGGFYIEPVAKNDTRITFFMNIDPRISHLPTFVLNWSSANVMWVLLRQMGKAAERALDPKSAYATRMATRPEVYGFFRARAKPVLARLPDEPPSHSR